MIRMLILCFCIFFSTCCIAQDTLSIEQAIQTGLQNNFSIKLSRNDQGIAENSNTLGNAGFLPTITGNYNNTNGITNSRAELSNGMVRQGTGVRSNNTSANALLTWRVFDGFNMFIVKQNLAELQRIGQYQAKANIELTIAQIIIAYNSIIVQEKLRNVILEAMTLSRERKELEEIRKSIGVGSAQPILQAMVDFNTDSARLLQQINNIQNSKSDLNRLLARDINTPIFVYPNISIRNNFNLTELQTSLNNQNPQLLTARAQQNTAQFAIGTVRSNYFPQINLFGGYNYSRNQTPVGATLLNQSNGLTYGITAAVNVFNGGITRTDWQNAKIQLESSKLIAEDTRQALQNELNKTFNNYITNLSLINLQENNINIAKQDVAIAVGRFKLANINDLDLRLIQQRLIDAEASLLNAQFIAKQSEVELLRLSGQLLNN